MSESRTTIRYCRRCVMPETKPDIFFDEEGVCSACRHFERRGEVDWDARRAELQRDARALPLAGRRQLRLHHPGQRRQGQHHQDDPDARAGA